VLTVDILTIFPAIFDSFLSTSLIAKAAQRGLFSAQVVDIRSFAAPPHYSVDDTPYGGGAGMVMRADVLVPAIEASRERTPGTHVVLLSASGRKFTQQRALELSEKSALTLVCGRYEGVDQRVVDLVVDEEICIGDFVLMGGEVPAMALLEAVLRLRPSVLGNEDSAAFESFSHHPGRAATRVEAPHYTRPAEYRGLEVPAVLLSGNHAEVSRWREAQSITRTRQMRPDLSRD
jgi:tRNA (guanine37-N1)-methyltransferase